MFYLTAALGAPAPGAAVIPVEVLMSLSVKLKELRLRNSKSLQEVADAVGASKAHIWELETGKSTNPSLELLRRIADHFKVTVASLIGESLDKVPENIIRMHRDLEKLTPRDQVLIENMISNMRTQSSKDET